MHGYPCPKFLVREPVPPEPATEYVHTCTCAHIGIHHTHACAHTRTHHIYVHTHACTIYLYTHIHAHTSIHTQHVPHRITHEAHIQLVSICIRHIATVTWIPPCLQVGLHIIRAAWPGTCWDRRESQLSGQADSVLCRCPPL